MRKGIKIKASLIILSWLLIMVHNIMPHNHQGSDLFILHGHYHSGISLNDEFHSHGDDHEVCGISGLLFHQLSQDNLFIEKNINDYSFTELRKERIPDNILHFLHRTCYYTSVSLRAPPAA